MKKIIFTFCTSICLLTSINAQTFYVNSQTGEDLNIGNTNNPLKTIQKAMEIANQLTGNGDITIKIMPGIYLLNDKIDINPVRILNENSKLRIEASILPGDSLWTPENMPIIGSSSPNNSKTQFEHSTGFLVASSFVEFRGIKFYGNANPLVKYYYPITRENPNLKKLVVSQCMFIGDINTAIIQGGIWAHGIDIVINHNVFYQCRNAVLLFQNINNSIISNNIIYNAYESAFWMGDDQNMIFENNIISNCNYFWVGNPESKIEFKISNSIITENKHFRGNWGRNGLTESKQNFIETNINKIEKIKLIERDSEVIPESHLHISPESAGYDLNTGIFK
jgi:hypothetical protein